MTFQKDFTVGTYIICIGSSSTTYTGTFIGHFTGYQIYSKLTPRAYTGQALNSFDLEFSYVEKECDKLLYFSVIEGALPEGLQMTLSGAILIRSYHILTCSYYLNYLSSYFSNILIDLIL